MLGNIYSFSSQSDGHTRIQVIVTVEVLAHHEVGDLLEKGQTIEVEQDDDGHWHITDLDPKESDDDGK